MRFWSVPDSPRLCIGLPWSPGPASVAVGVARDHCPGLAIILEVFLRISRDFSGFLAISYGGPGFPGISRDFLGFLGIFLISSDFRGFLGDFPGFLGISWDFLGFRGISGDISGFPGFF